MLILVRESLPRWYGLSWNAREKAIVLSIHEDLFRTHRTIPSSDLVRLVMDEFKFSSFNLSFETDFGFDGALIFRKKKGDFRHFVGPLPEIRKRLNDPCDDCKGSGKQDWGYGKCLLCDGKGKKVVYDHKPGFALSASLNLFFSTVYFPEEKTSAKIPQLMTVQLTTQASAHGGEMSGMYSPELVNWLCCESNESVSFVSKAMRLAHGRMVGNQFCSPSDFRAHISQNGWFVTSCPGSGCGLHPIERRMGHEGCEFSSHNVDSPHQQLTLLAGLAALHDRVDRDLRK